MKKIPNFWGQNTNNMCKKFTDFILNQYYSKDILYVYTDASVYNERFNISAISTVLVNKGEVHVIKGRAFPYENEKIKSVYAEIKGIIFAIRNTKKHKNFNGKAIIYCDLNFIDDILNKKVNFEDEKLNKVKYELINCYYATIKNYDIELKYLEKSLREHNPFYNAAHNASKKITKEIMERKKKCRIHYS